MDKLLINDLRKSLDDLNEIEESIKSKRAFFEDSIRHHLSAREYLSDKVERLKRNLSAEALAEYQKSKVKKLDGGIGIRVSKKIKYDEALALDFAKSKDMFIILDKKSFEKAASGLGLDFVEEFESVTVTFPKVIKL